MSGALHGLCIITSLASMTPAGSGSCRGGGGGFLFQPRRRLTKYEAEQGTPGDGSVAFACPEADGPGLRRAQVEASLSGSDDPLDEDPKGIKCLALKLLAGGNKTRGARPHAPRHASRRRKAPTGAAPAQNPTGLACAYRAVGVHLRSWPGVWRAADRGHSGFPWQQRDSCVACKGPNPYLQGVLKGKTLTM